MIWKIIQLIISIGLIVGGLSGELVLRGTDSSAALVVFGVFWLVLDIVLIVTHKKNSEDNRPMNRTKRVGRSPLFFILCGIYIVINAIIIFLLYDELLYGPEVATLIIAICGKVISVVGIVVLLLKKSFGIVIALAGSVISIAFTVISGIFIIGVHPRFDTSGFVGFMLMSLLPWFLLWLQITLAQRKQLAEPMAGNPVNTGSTNVSENIGKKPTSIIDEYKMGLSYLDECGAFDEVKFHEFNRITGNKFSPADIENQLASAKLMMRGMEDLKQTLRSTMVEAIGTFEELERQGVDLSKYSV